MANETTITAEQFAAFAKSNLDKANEILRNAESENAKSLPPVVIKGKTFITLQFDKVVKVNGKSYQGMIAVKQVNEDGTEYVRRTRAKPQVPQATNKRK